MTEAEVKKGDAVSHDKVWKQSVDNEQKGLKKWAANWSYLADYDSKVEKIHMLVISHFW